jgi:hypothetical protein
VAVYELMGIVARQPAEGGSTLELDYIPRRRDSVTVDINGQC